MSDDREALLALAERVEELDGPDRGVNDEIAGEMFTGKHRVCIKGLSDEAGGMWMFRYPSGSIGSALRFTGSLDAAMTLVPEGAQWSFGSHYNIASVEVYTFVDAVGPVCHSFQGEGGTPALALTAACLRAHAGAQP